MKDDRAARAKMIANRAKYADKTYTQQLIDPNGRKRIDHGGACVWETSHNVCMPEKEIFTKASVQKAQQNSQIGEVLASQLRAAPSNATQANTYLANNADFTAHAEWYITELVLDANGNGGGELMAISALRRCAASGGGDKQLQQLLLNSKLMQKLFARWCYDKDKANCPGDCVQGDAYSYTRAALARGVGAGLGFAAGFGGFSVLGAAAGQTAGSALAKATGLDRYKACGVTSEAEEATNRVLIQAESWSEYLSGYPMLAQAMNLLDELYANALYRSVFVFVLQMVPALIAQGGLGDGTVFIGPIFAMVRNALGTVVYGSDLGTSWAAFSKDINDKYAKDWKARPYRKFWYIASWLLFIVASVARVFSSLESLQTLIGFMPEQIKELFGTGALNVLARFAEGSLGFLTTPYGLGMLAVIMMVFAAFYASNSNVRDRFTAFTESTSWIGTLIGHINTFVAVMQMFGMERSPSATTSTNTEVALAGGTSAQSKTTGSAAFSLQTYIQSDITATRLQQALADIFGGQNDQRFKPLQGVLAATLKNGQADRARARADIAAALESDFPDGDYTTLDYAIKAAIGVTDEDITMCSSRSSANALVGDAVAPGLEGLFA